jgi:hypothetical protein
MALASVAAAGHFDELRGATASSTGPTDTEAADSNVDEGQLAPAWTRFFGHLTDKTALDLNQRAWTCFR